MSQLKRSLAVVAACLAILPAVAAAQTGTTTRINGAAGLSLSTGNYGDRNDAGYSLIFGIGMSQAVSPLSFRAEGMYNEFQEKFDGAKSHASALTANAIYDFSAGPKSTFVPYAIGGIGYYSTREPLYDFENQSNMGWNIGGGVRFPLSGFSAYVEARYHSVGNVDTHFAPIVFGLVF